MHLAPLFAKAFSLCLALRMSVSTLSYTFLHRGWSSLQFIVSFDDLSFPGVIFIAQGPAAVSGTTMSRWQRAETGERLASQPSTSSLRCISRLVHERHGGAGDVVTHTGGEFCFTRIFLRWSAQLGVSAPEEEHFWRFASRVVYVFACEILLLSVAWFLADLWPCRFALLGFQQEHVAVSLRECETWVVPLLNTLDATGCNLKPRIEPFDLTLIPLKRFPLHCRLASKEFFMQRETARRIQGRAFSDQINRANTSLITFTTIISDSRYM
jgi:hypothetical protein